MNKLARALETKGYRVLNTEYRGILDDYPQILAALESSIDQWQDSEAPLHFVGHSFGGILVRGLLAQNESWNRGRCVMLGSPNKGTQTASFMLSHWWFKHFVPKVAAHLVPESEFLQTLAEPEVETGIIAGNVDFSLVVPVSWYYRRATDNAPGDGVVELSNTQCSTMTDFIVLPLHHSFMMWNSELIQQVAHFLAHGHFSDDYKPIKPDQS